MVTWKNKEFYIDGVPTKIHSGAIHYFRSLPDKWPDLLLKLKQCGLNTVETYCAWNLHEEEEGVFDFSGRLDLVRFIELAEELGLYVIVRPGPYICAEWELGGLPAWLLKDEARRLRTDEGDYLTYVKRYFDQLIPRLLPHLQTRGGKIILFSVENEYGSFGNSTRYMNTCADLLRSYGIDVPLFTADGHTDLFLSGGHADGCLMGLDFGYDCGQLLPEHSEALEHRQPNAPFFHAEHWIGMFSHWEEPFIGYGVEHTAAEVKRHLEEGGSFNLYMFHGGTNFGFTNGANDGGLGYQPDVTSYDYDAPLTEWGEVTPKYFAIQKVMSEYLGKELPTPSSVPLMSLGRIELPETAPLFAELEAIGGKHRSSCLHGMEYYGQNYGYILYRTQLTPSEANKLVLSGVADRVRVYTNGVFRGVLYRNDPTHWLEGEWVGEGGTLDLLVENMGRINFGPWMDRGDRKGLLNHVYITGPCCPRQGLNEWEIYTLPMKDLSPLSFGETVVEGQPHFYRGTFRVQEPKDCFVHPDGFDKGFIVVNGFNLGRYWEKGPQRSLYLPASILKEENEIIVYAETPSATRDLSISDTHILAETRTDEGPVTIV